jgi:hypothetical protein
MIGSDGEDENEVSCIFPSFGTNEVVVIGDETTWTGYQQYETAYLFSYHPLHYTNQAFKRLFDYHEHTTPGRAQ